MSDMKRRPVIGKLVTPATPFEFKVLSPTGVIINRDIGGVGLGIVAALENIPTSFSRRSIFDISPAKYRGDDDMKVSQAYGFLNSCYLCNKRLHGKDIYMYRGEKGFCSPECRNKQIAMDEKPEKYCGSQASSSSTSPLITTGIFAI